MSLFTCKICNNDFKKKQSLQVHLNEKRCKSDLLNNYTKLHEFILQKEQEIQIQEIPQEIQIQEIPQEIPQETSSQLTHLKFDGIFQGRENEIRITPDKRISVFDFIKVVGGQSQPDKTWKNILSNYSKEVRNCYTNFKFEGQGQKMTPVVNVQGMVKLLFWLPGELAKQFRSKSAETMIRYLGGDLTLIEEFLQKCSEENCKVVKIIEPSSQLKFDGIFQGRESEIRITSNKMISVFDFIKVVGGQIHPYSTWKRILDEHKDEVCAFCANLKFPGAGQKMTPVVNVQGMVKLLFWLPGESAKQFRSKSAETMIRYLGGDLTLIDEIKHIDQVHQANPNNIAQIFRNEVNNNNNNLFTQDLINTSKKLINYYGNKNDIFYMFSFKLAEEWYAKYGIVGELREFHERISQHIAEFEQICFHNIIQCSNICKVEADFKNSSLVMMNKTKVPKKYGGNHTEIIKLSELVTTETIKQEMIKVAGERMLDPLPPSYNRVIEETGIEQEREKTKQIEIQSNELTKQSIEITKQKQIECVELTKQREIELKKLEVEFEMKKLEFEMRKMEFEMNK